ncbi:hypothetical protein, partial [Blattabacterium cuenoti]|uniref:hypothetical protein n=1 Tax=Blattabacterium cuenoti TaxID=1653831 RepID=UPI00311D82D3
NDRLTKEIKKGKDIISLKDALPICSFFFKKKRIESICIIHLTKKKKYPFYNEIQIIVINVFPEKNIIIKPNEELGKLDIVTDVKIKWKKCSILNRSLRGNNSFGSTGIL